MRWRGPVGLKTTMGLVVLLALGATAAGCGSTGHATSNTAPPTTATTLPTPTTLVVPYPCAINPLMQGCGSHAAGPCQIYVRTTGCPYTWIDSNTGMAMVDAPNGQTYQVPVNAGTYHVEPDGSITYP
jgi:hypothetical protein